MKRISASWARGIALVAFLGVAGSSWACDIALWYHVTPEPQQTDVPLNARVSMLIARNATLSLTWLREGANGSMENVPFTLSWRPGDGTHENAELVPVSPLAASSRYRIDLKLQGSEPFTLTSFTTGTSQDATPPAAPKVTVGKVVPYVPRDAASGAECFVDTGFARLSASSEGAATYLLHEGETLLAAGLPEEVSLAFSCPAADRKIRATLTAVDLAGNMSEPVLVTIEQRCVRDSPLGGCSASGSAGGLLLAALVWGALTWQRRRAARHGDVGLRGGLLAAVLALLVPSIGLAAELPAHSQNEVPLEAVPTAVPLTQTAPGGALGPSVWTLLGAGLLGEAVLVFPMSLSGAFVGAWFKEPCSDHCDGVTYWRHGAAIGGSLGVALGASSGMMLMGAAQGSQASWLATFGGATLGSSLGLVVALSVQRLMDPILDRPGILLLPPAGALVGALVGYQLSRAEAGRSSERFALKGTQLALILGGATLGTAGGIGAVLWINDFFYYPTPFLAEDKPLRFLLPPAGAILGGLAGYGLSTLVEGASSYSAASEGAQVRILSGVTPLPGGGMLSVMGRF